MMSDLRSLFLRWSSPSQRIYEMNGVGGINPDIMELVIRFGYTGSVPVMEENVLELLRLADQLNMTDLVQICVHFLGERLSADNCLTIWRCTSFIYSPRLRIKAFSYIVDHFDDVASFEELLDLTVEELADLLGTDKLGVRKESTVYEVMMRWIAHMPQRKEHLCTLMSKVRLCLTSMEYINMSVMSNDLVKNDLPCMAMVIEASQDLYHFLTHHAFTGFCNPSLCPRLPSAVVLAMGGWSSGSPINDIEAYDIRVNRWVKVTPGADQSCAYHGTAFLDGHIYCIGGFNVVEYFNSVTRFHTVSRTWQEVSPMHYRRCYVSVTVLNGFIYALGGFDGNSRQSSAEYYQPELNQWRQIANMHHQRSDASCTTLQGKVYIFGGTNGWECLQSAEYYNPLTNDWTLISDMRFGRRGVGVVAYQDCIYVVGGCSGDDRLSTTEVYNPRTDNWTLLHPMNRARSNFGIAVIEDRIVVVGGFDGIQTTAAVESYDFELDNWSEACDMQIPRSALSCCAVYGLANMNEYTFDRDDLPLRQLDQEVNEDGGDESHGR